MATQKTETTPPPSLSKAERNGILPGVVHFAIDVADRGQSTAIAVLQDARTELRTAVEHSVDWAEKLTASMFRFARKGIQRVDDASSEALSGVGHVLSGAVKSARETTHAAAELATTATSSLSGRATA